MKNCERRLENSPRWQSASGTRGVEWAGGEVAFCLVVALHRTAVGGGGGVAATAAAGGTKQLELPVLK